jgi:hypothetical protein
MRRCDGIEKQGGWWCTACQRWVVKPLKPLKQSQALIEGKGK